MRRLIQKYFDEIALDTGKYCFGVDDTLRGLELGAVETLIVWENLDVTRHTLRSSTGETVIVHTAAPPPTASNAAAAAGDKATAVGIAALSEQDREKFIDKATGLEMEQQAEPQPLLEWLAEKYQEFGAALEFVTNRSTEGSQFVRGFGGALVHRFAHVDVWLNVISMGRYRRGAAIQGRFRPDRRRYGRGASGLVRTVSSA